MEKNMVASTWAKLRHQQRDLQRQTERDRQTGTEKGRTETDNGAEKAAWRETEGARSETQGSIWSGGNPSSRWEGH